MCQQLDEGYFKNLFRYFNIFLHSRRWLKQRAMLWIPCANMWQNRTVFLPLSHPHKHMQKKWKKKALVFCVHSSVSPCIAAPLDLYFLPNHCFSKKNERLNSLPNYSNLDWLEGVKVELDWNFHSYHTL